MLISQEISANKLINMLKYDTQLELWDSSWFDGTREIKESFCSDNGKNGDGCGVQKHYRVTIKKCVNQTQQKQIVFLL